MQKLIRSDQRFEHSKYSLPV